MARAHDCDLLVSVGTSGTVTPASEIPQSASASGYLVIHVNLIDVSKGTPNEVTPIGKATDVLKRLVAEVCFEDWAAQGA